MSTTDTTCTCPSGDGSLRWPCPTHPPTERDERLREARHLAGQSRDVLDKDYLDDALITLDEEVTRLDAVVTAVRDLRDEWPNSMSALHPKPLCSCGDEYPCATVRALDRGAS